MALLMQLCMWANHICKVGRGPTLSTCHLKTGAGTFVSYAVKYIMHYMEMQVLSQNLVDMARNMIQNISDMHCRSDEYLAEEIALEG